MANEGYDLGVAIWDLGGDSELALGTTEIPTKGGISATYQETTWSPTYDQTGDTPRDVIKTGESGEITVNMAAFNIEAFAKIFPAATVVEHGVDSEKKKLIFGGGVGNSLLSAAKTLTIRPQTLFDGSDAALGNGSEDITYLAAIPRANFSINFQLNTERVYPVLFVAIYDAASGGFVVFGDNSITGEEV